MSADRLVGVGVRAHARGPVLGQRGLLVVLGLVLALAALEAGLWIANFPLGEHPRGLFQPDAVMGYRLSPNFTGRVLLGEVAYHVATNSDGLRGPAVRPRGQVSRRVLGVGDSFTYGMGVEEPQTYLRRLERRLNGDGTSIEVLNGGVPAYGTLQAAQFLDRVGLALAPDVVILGFYTNDDVVPEEFTPHQVVHGYLVSHRGAQPTPWRDLTLWLRRHVRVYAFVATTVRRSAGLRGWLASTGLLHVGDPTPRELRYYLRAVPPDVERQWQRTEEVLVAMREEIARAGARLIVLGIPDRVAVHEPLMARAARQGGVGLDRLDAVRPQARLAAACARAGIAFVDALPPLRQAAQRGQAPYFAHDAHWSAGGHAVAAETLFDYFRAHPGLLERG